MPTNNRLRGSVRWYPRPDNGRRTQRITNPGWYPPAAPITLRGHPRRLRYPPGHNITRLRHPPGYNIANTSGRRWGCDVTGGCGSVLGNRQHSPPGARHGCDVTGGCGSVLVGAVQEGGHLGACGVMSGAVEQRADAAAFGDTGGVQGVDGGFVDAVVGVAEPGGLSGVG